MVHLASDIPYLSEGEIEARAEAMLASYQRGWGAIAGPPVPVERLLEVHLDMAILWEEIPAQGDKAILACIVPDRRLIVLNQAQLPLFERYLGTGAFTLAHETGHWDLHVVKNGPNQLSLGLDSGRRFICRWDISDRREWQANRYAAALLMPEALVRETAAGLDLSCWPALYDLKDAFGVTISALTTRLGQLGLVHTIQDRLIFLTEEEYQRYRGQLPMK